MVFSPSLWCCGGKYNRRQKLAEKAKTPKAQKKPKKTQKTKKTNKVKKPKKTKKTKIEEAGLEGAWDRRRLLCYINRLALNAPGGLGCLGLDP